MQVSTLARIYGPGVKYSARKNSEPRVPVTNVVGMVILGDLIERGKKHGWILSELRWGYGAGALCPKSDPPSGLLGWDAPPAPEREISD